MTAPVHGLHPLVQQAQGHLATAADRDLEAKATGLTAAAQALEAALADDSDPGDPAAAGL